MSSSMIREGLYYQLILENLQKLKTDVVFIGLSRYVEIWDKDKWLRISKGFRKKYRYDFQRLLKKRVKGNE